MSIISFLFPPQPVLCPSLCPHTGLLSIFPFSVSVSLSLLGFCLLSHQPLRPFTYLFLWVLYISAVIGLTLLHLFNTLSKQSQTPKFIYLTFICLLENLNNIKQQQKSENGNDCAHIDLTPNKTAVSICCWLDLSVQWITITIIKKFPPYVSYIINFPRLFNFKPSISVLLPLY